MIRAGACFGVAMVEITREFTFEAAHHLPPVGPDHKCFRLHGHLFRVEVHVAGELDPAMGWVMDFGDLARLGREVIGRLDHSVLNDLPELGVPTSENIARYLFRELSRRIPGLAGITVHESPASRCTFRPGAVQPEAERIAVDAALCEPVVLSCAHFLLFPDAEREPIHGHDYRATATAWVPSGRSEAASHALAVALNRVAAALDHRLLIPETPAVGSLDVSERTVTLVLPRERLGFAARDCALVECSNTTTEALAAVLAARLSVQSEVGDLGAAEVEVGLSEGLGASARACRRVDRTLETCG